MNVDDADGWRGAWLRGGAIGRLLNAASDFECRTALLLDGGSNH